MRVALRQGLELNYIVLLCSGDCTLRGVHYVIVRGGRGGCSIVKLLTPSTALCKYPIYLYIITHIHMHYRFNNSTEINILKHQTASLLLEIEFTV